MSSDCGYVVRQRKNAGRALVTSRDLYPQELIVSELPFLVSPVLNLFDDDSDGASKSTSRPSCLHCFKFIYQDQGKKCEKCGLFICNDKCGSNHTSTTCIVSRKLANFMDAKNEIETNLRVSICLSVFAMIRLRRRDTGKVAQLMTRPTSMEMNPAERSVLTFILAFVEYQSLHKNGSNVDFAHFERSTIDDAIGIFTINGVKVQKSPCTLYPPCVAVYPTFSLANHACISSAVYDVNCTDLRLELRSRLPLRENREITVSYLSPFTTTSERQRSSYSRWGFKCECARCADPTELGTCASAIKCTEHGHDESWACLLIPPNDPDSEEEVWTCQTQGCHCTATESEAAEKIQAVKDKLSTFNEMESIGDTLKRIECGEQTLFSSNNYLGPNHCIILALEYKLVILYSQLEKEDKARKRPLTTRPMRERRIQMCLHLLDIGARIDPGATPWRGVILQALILPWLHLAKTDFASKVISRRQFQLRVTMAMKATNESGICLRDNDVIIQRTPV